MSALAYCALCAGCRGTSPEFTSTPDPRIFEESDFSASRTETGEKNPPPDKYRIQTGDLVRLASPDFTEPYSARIAQDGNLTHPTLGTFVVAGKTVTELYEEIVARDPRYRRFPPCCNCELIYYVTGEIKSPGPKPYLNELKVSQAIEAAGGFTEFANKKRVTVGRANGKNKTVKLGGSPQDDSQVFPGDSVHVRRRGLFAR